MAPCTPTAAFCPHTELQHIVEDTSHLFNNVTVRAWAQVFSDRHARGCEFEQPKGPNGRIHRIFAISNFSRLSAISGLEKPLDTWLDPKWTITDKFYERIRPSLVLATRLLEETGEFFDTVLWGKIEDRRDGRYYALEEGLTEGPSVFPEGHDSLKNLQIFTGYNEESFHEDYATQKYGIFPNEGTQRLATQAIQLNTRFTTFFTHPHYDEFTDEVKQRILFILAVTLVHELAHVVYTYRRKFTAEERKVAFAARVLKRQEIAAFLSTDSWKLFGRLRPGGDLQCYKGVAGTNILEVMSTVVFMEEFKATRGCYPWPEEISIPKPSKVIHSTAFPPIYDYECSKLAWIYRGMRPALSDNENEAGGSDGTGHAPDTIEISEAQTVVAIEDNPTHAIDSCVYSINLACDDDKESLNGIDQIADGTDCMPTPPQSPSVQDEPEDYSDWWAAIGHQAMSNPLHQAARGGRMGRGRRGTRDGQPRTKLRYQR
ncbi:hypothetical protein LTR10_022226 [Elasticomyces elasticus]|uniref:SprT-like domain-containing protein n=1 Tax=Exophiala sideris TaxID=1016849 RepID=A0ABR0JIS9_9EURO|nr:hypothetical protein LTR10_022226 [Elasticomyces elasticus]KAK5034404.1 hypothetical protein LTS07_003325 [Exophiala sideris]KAK5042701.1 hypothetical protein LTR13_001549 [Exophiala sideris]KAK5065783.1 hypothetical protein LTR69_003333 [Exophiala sideris]KAK5185757.1 hypothetical protein LTR44_001806 [Eurotiomycetes sp. CCFEE 6388]